MFLKITDESADAVIQFSLKESLETAAEELKKLKKIKKNDLTDIQKEDIEYFENLFKALIVVIGYYMPAEEAKKIVANCKKIAGVAQR